MDLNQIVSELKTKYGAKEKEAELEKIINYSLKDLADVLHPNTYKEKNKLTNMESAELISINQRIKTIQAAVGIIREFKRKIDGEIRIGLKKTTHTHMAPI